MNLCYRKRGIKAFKLADVDISPNTDPFKFWTSESEYIK